MSSKSSPRTSECSTASPGIQGKTASSTISSISTAELPPISNASINGSSSTTSSSYSGTPSSATTATKNSSAFSVIGKTLTRLIQNCYAGKPATTTKKNGSKRLVRKHLIRKRIAAPNSSHSSSSSTSLFSASTSSLSGRREIQKWFFSCNGCSRPITRDDVKADNAIFAMDGVWHRSHLVCFKCNANIGDEYRPFIASGLKDKHPLCIDCYMVAEHSTCTICHAPLFETCVEIDEKQMHQSCFVCERCKAPFEDGQYALINGKPYDLDCYYFKAFENAFALQLPGSFFDLHATSPPPMATVTDSTTSLPTITPSITPPTSSSTEDQTYFKRKTAEFVSLCDVGHPLPPPEKTLRKELSAEVFETEHIKFPLKSPPSEARSPSLDLGSKEKVAATSLASPPVIFASGGIDGKSETKQPDGTVSSSAGTDVKKVEEEKKDEGKKNDKPNSVAPVTESPIPHPDTYAAAAALTPPPISDAVVGGGVDGKSETKHLDGTVSSAASNDVKKIEEEKKDGKPNSATESPTPHPDTYAAAAALMPTSIIDSVVGGGVDGKSETKKSEIEEKKDGQSKLSEAKDDKHIGLPSESPTPHPDTYAAAAAATPVDSVVVGNVDGKSVAAVSDGKKKEEKKEDIKKEEKKEEEKSKKEELKNDKML